MIKLKPEHMLGPSTTPAFTTHHHHEVEFNLVPECSLLQTIRCFMVTASRMCLPVNAVVFTALSLYLRLCSRTMLQLLYSVSVLNIPLPLVLAYAGFDFRLRTCFAKSFTNAIWMTFPITTLICIFFV